MSEALPPVNFLLVDDLDENLLSLEALLRREGLNCLKARSGDEALELLLVHEVALALLDVQMPGMDGFQLAEYMRGNERSRGVPIIFVTAGTTDVQRRFRGYEAGAVDFIQKPIEADILRSKATVFFELYRQRQQLEAQRDELKAYSETLKLIDRHKNEFIAMLGHELRNPVMALGGGLRRLDRIGGPADAAGIRELMHTQLFNLSRLIEDLLDISRIGQGKISLKKRMVEITAIVRAAVDTSHGHIEAAQHELVVELPPDAIWVHGDPTRLTQVVSNLITNAAKYTPAGGRVEVAVRTSGDEVEISVADNGIGIPQEMQAQIFDIFTQIPLHESRSQDGLGVGLALVKQLAEMHEGAIEVSSAGADAGSRFVVRLPMTAAESASA